MRVDEIHLYKTDAVKDVWYNWIHYFHDYIPSLQTCEEFYGPRSSKENKPLSLVFLDDEKHWNLIEVSLRCHKTFPCRRAASWRSDGWADDHLRQYDGPASGVLNPNRGDAGAFSGDVNFGGSFVAGEEAAAVRTQRWRRLGGEQGHHACLYVASFTPPPRDPKCGPLLRPPSSHGLRRA